MRRAAARVLLLASWVVSIDSMARAIWSWAKLGSFGYHVPWSLVGALFVAGAVSAYLLRSRQPLGVAVALIPVALLLIARHYS